MLGLTKREQSVIVLRDADGIVAAVRAALDRAAPEERAGLERALEIVEDASATTFEDLRARWVRRRLDAAGVAGPADSIPAIKALREAAPGLSLKSAVDLAKTARSAESARRGTWRNPARLPSPGPLASRGPRRGGRVGRRGGAPGRAAGPGRQRLRPPRNRPAPGVTSSAARPSTSTRSP